jgi:hypothetical protein
MPLFPLLYLLAFKNVEVEMPILLSLPRVFVGLRTPKVEEDGLICFFFMFFIVVGHLFLLNMFIGIVINVFNTEKENL